MSSPLPIVTTASFPFSSFGTFPHPVTTRVDINRTTGEIKVYSYYVVVPEIDEGDTTIDEEGNEVDVPPEINIDAQIILEEAREMVKGNPYSFLHVDRAEIDLDPSIDVHDTKVYEKARDNLNKMISDGEYMQDENPCLYIYRQTMNGRSQTGLVFCASIDEYINNTIKKHEFTRADKEQDRINHVDYCDANTGPIF